MDFPLKTAAVRSAAAAFGFWTYSKNQWSTLFFAVYFITGIILQFVIWAFWTVILYPKFFSPLRGLPEPKNSSWFNGNWKKIRDEPSGAPMLEWYLYSHHLAHLSCLDGQSVNTNSWLGQLRYQMMAWYAILRFSTLSACYSLLPRPSLRSL